MQIIVSHSTTNCLNNRLYWLAIPLCLLSIILGSTMVVIVILSLEVLLPLIRLQPNCMLIVAQGIWQGLGVHRWILMLLAKQSLVFMTSLMLFVGWESKAIVLENSIWKRIVVDKAMTKCVVKGIVPFVCLVGSTVQWCL